MGGFASGSTCRFDVCLGCVCVRGGRGGGVTIAKHCSHLVLRVRGTGMHMRELRHSGMNAWRLKSLLDPDLANGTLSASAGAGK